MSEYKESGHDILNKVYYCEDCNAIYRTKISYNFSLECKHNTNTNFPIDYCIEEPSVFCNFCEKVLVPLDEEIADAIIQLNEKGYKTKYSCSGHYGREASSSAYVSFDDLIDMTEVFELYPLPYPWNAYHDEYPQGESEFRIYANAEFKNSLLDDDCFDGIAYTIKCKYLMTDKCTNNVIGDQIDALRTMIRTEQDQYDSYESYREHVENEYARAVCDKLKEWVNSLPRYEITSKNKSFKVRKKHMKYLIGGYCGHCEDVTDIISINPSFTINGSNTNDDAIDFLSCKDNYKFMLDDFIVDLNLNSSCRFCKGKMNYKPEHVYAKDLYKEFYKSLKNINSNLSMSDNEVLNSGKMYVTSPILGGMRNDIDIDYNNYSDGYVHPAHIRISYKANTSNIAKIIELIESVPQSFISSHINARIDPTKIYQLDPSVFIKYDTEPKSMVLHDFTLTMDLFMVYNTLKNILKTPENMEFAISPSQEAKRQLCLDMPEFTLKESKAFKAMNSRWSLFFNKLHQDAINGNELKYDNYKNLCDAVVMDNFNYQNAKFQDASKYIYLYAVALYEDTFKLMDSALYLLKRFNNPFVVIKQHIRKSWE